MRGASYAGSSNKGGSNVTGCGKYRRARKVVRAYLLGIDDSPLPRGAVRSRAGSESKSKTGRELRSLILIYIFPLFFREPVDIMIRYSLEQRSVSP